MALKILYSTNAHSTGGRNGHAKSKDGIVDVDLAMPPKPGRTTPEDLFATGYAACFGGAMDHVAKNVLKLNPTSMATDCTVELGQDDGGFGLQVTMKATVGGLSEADAKRLVETAHGVCPYSKAIKGNVHVKLETAVA